MRKNLKNILVLAAGLVFLNTSCSDKLELAPVSSISNTNFWKSADQFDAFVTGVHARFRSHNGNFLYLGELRADIYGMEPGSSASFTGEASQGLERMWLQTLDLDNPGVSNFGGFYNNINQLNLLIDKLNTTNVVTEANKNYYLGIAYGMRAFYYFQLLRSWGGVVIQTEPLNTIDIANLAKPASTQEEVMQLIKSDLNQSSSSFGNDFTFRQTKSFWSKAATLMLKAEVYLWTSYRSGGAADATMAKEALTEIKTNVPELNLVPNFENVFAVNNRGNAEIIFASRYQLNEANQAFIAGNFVPQSGLITNFYDSLANRQFNVTTDNWGGLLRVPVKVATFRHFKDLDTRKRTTIQPAYQKVNDNYVIAGAFVKKYQGEQNAGARQYTNDFPIYRYADLQLLLAEAKLLLGEDPASEINSVRARAYGANYNPAVHAFPSQPIDANPQEALLQERFYEFIFEGKRWYDLRRMGDNFVYAHTTLTPAEAYKLLWPIDRNSLTNNRALEQTPGYSQF
ncbi:SusD family outer membrane lipoprotein NanU [Adhaeribacter swui]|uniref:SusD family outer membrane lipoprotein NanU n=1 Tax=Adhaeribacter swui TaxID=2086471 RepID=A0A7G7G554_9BACT|nr:SusD family outer membrane lipoprotein NanU [Adhaeribacter swui]QNF32288.1 SusD family outer membrane lipoprotein NanU [Adhaeribacter swui]